MVFLGRYLSFLFVSASLLLSFTSHADESKELSFEEMALSKEPPPMKWIQKFKDRIPSGGRLSPESWLHKISALESIINAHENAFIMFHARDSEGFYTELDAMSVFHPAHDEFMKSFALVRTSSTAGFASGDGNHSNRKPTLYREPQNYVRHLVNRGLNVERLIQGKEQVVAIIGGGTGVQATGAFATLIAAFKGHPQFRTIALNITKNYLIYKGSTKSLVYLTRADFITKLEDSNLQLTEDQIVDFALQVDPTPPLPEFSTLYNASGWTDTGRGFDEGGNPILHNSALPLKDIRHFFENLNHPYHHEQVSKLIEKRVLARRAFLGNTKKASAFKIKPYTTPPVTRLDGQLANGTRVLLASPKRAYVIESKDFENDRISVYSVKEDRKTGKRFKIVVPVHYGNVAAVQYYSQFIKSLQKQGIMVVKSHFYPEFIALPENSNFIEWVSGELKSSFSINTSKGMKTITIQKKLKETQETRVFEASYGNQRFLLTVPKNLSNEEHVGKIAKEIRRTEEYNAHGIRTLPIIASGEIFILKPILKGKLMSKVIEQWEKAGFPESNPAIDAMVNLLETNAQKGIYLTRALSENFMFANNEIVSIRAAALKTDMSYEDIMKEYSEVLKDRFGEKFVERLVKK